MPLELIALLLVVLLLVLALLVVAARARGRARGRAGGASTSVPVEKILAAEWSEGSVGFGEAVYAGGVLRTVRADADIAGAAPGAPYFLLIDDDVEETPVDALALFRLTHPRYLGKYLWYFYQAPEGRYALRYTGKQFINPGRLIGELRPLLTGTPPHAIPVAAWLGFIRAHHFDVAFRGRQDGTVRFGRGALETPAEIEETRERLLAFLESKLGQLDWAEYDQRVRSLVAEPVEHGFDIIVDERRQALHVANAHRGGIANTTWPHLTAVSAHTHPLRHPDRLEPPSEVDVRFLFKSRGNAWSIVAAPEGDYLFGGAPEREPKAVDEFCAAYARELDTVRGRTLAAAVEERCAMLRSFGLRVHFRPAPSWNGARPERPFTDLLELELAPRRYEAAARMSAAEVLGADWGALETLFASDQRTEWYFRARFEAGRLVPQLELALHPEENQAVLPGPVEVIYHAREDAFRPYELSGFFEKKSWWAWLLLITPRMRAVCRPKPGATPRVPRAAMTVKNAGRFGFEMASAARALPVLPRRVA